MKKLISSILLACFLFLGVGFINLTFAKTSSVKGYYKPSTGKYVAPYFKSTPNKTKLDNFTTKGNTNPYTGKKGNTNPYKIHK